MERKSVKPRAITVAFSLLPDSEKHPEDKALLDIIGGWEREGRGRKADHFRRAIQLEAGLDSPSLYVMVKELLERVKQGAIVATPQQQEALEAVISCESERWNL